MSLMIRERRANPENYGGQRTADQIRYLVLHYTGNDGDTAAGNASYFQNTVTKTSAHYFVDDREIFRSVPELWTAWAVGGKKYPRAGESGGGTMYGVITNTNSISVELCDTVRDGALQASEATLQNAAALCREIMERYGIPANRVYRHFDVTGKRCPAYFVDGERWAAFKARLETAAENPDNTPHPAHREGVAWAVERGILRGNAAGDLMLRQALTREQFCTMLYRYHLGQSEGTDG